jgi:ubiquinone/menaquinone biosynthesis C-methylase UbiE
MSAAIQIVLFLFVLFLVFQIIIRIIRRYLKFPAPAIIGRLLDSSYRRKVQPPDVLIRRSGIGKGMRVLEIGCGSGAFTVDVARAVGSSGEVYAFDIQNDMLEQLKRKLGKAENRDVKNVKLVLGDAHKLPFRNNFFDLVYLVTVLQEIPDKSHALSEIRRVLRPGGILAVTELLPDPDYPLKSTTIRMGEKAGFRVDQVSGNFFNYTVRFIVRKT